MGQVNDEVIEQVRAATLAIEGVESVDITNSRSTVNVLYKGTVAPADVYAVLHFGEVGKALRVEKLALLVHRKP